MKLKYFFTIKEQEMTDRKTAGGALKNVDAVCVLIYNPCETHNMAAEEKYFVVAIIIKHHTSGDKRFILLFWIYSLSQRSELHTSHWSILRDIYLKNLLVLKTYKTLAKWTRIYNNWFMFVFFFFTQTSPSLHTGSHSFCSGIRSPLTIKRSSSPELSGSLTLILTFLQSQDCLPIKI